MRHRLGFYWHPQHDASKHALMDFLRRTQPSLGRILDPDPAQISEVHQVSPNTLINPRMWTIDDNNGQAVREILADPAEAARDHVDRMVAKIREWQDQARERKLPFPSDTKLILSSANESNRGVPHGPNLTYNRHFGDYAGTIGFRVMLLNMSVGNPYELKSNGKPDWSMYRPLQEVLTRWNHIVSYHGYFQAQGPTHSWTDNTGKLREDFPHLAGRALYTELEAEHVLGETGIDAGIFDVAPGSGWQKMDVDGQNFAWMLEELHDLLPDYFLAMCPFAWDFKNEDWWSYDVTPVKDRLVAWAVTKDVGTPPTPPPPVEPGPAPITEWRAVVTAPAGLNIRSGPGTQHPIVTAAPEDAVLSVYTPLPEWLEVEHAGTRGYSASRYLMLATRPPDAPAPPKPTDGVSDAVRGLWDGWGGLIRTLADAYDVPVTTLAAVVLAESAGRAFDDDGRLLIRFENHIFWDLWGKDNADLYSRHFRFRFDATGKRWEGHMWRPDAGAWRPCHVGNRQEWEVFVFAQGLAYQPALESTSYGLPQILGMGYRAAGYDSAEALFRAFVTDGNAHLPAMLRWIQSRGLIDELQRRDYYGFAYVFNGPGNAATYAGIIEANVRQFEKLLAEVPA